MLAFSPRPHSIIRGSCTRPGPGPCKSHWARPLDTPPFCVYPLRPWITFTYLSLTVNRYAPSHEFDLSVPKALGGLRLETYTEFSWPPALKQKRSQDS